jgi:hypothetical protein
LWDAAKMPHHARVTGIAVGEAFVVSVSTARQLGSFCLAYTVATDHATPTALAPQRGYR